MTDKEIRRATLNDALDLAPRLRPEDRRECFSASGLPPELILASAVSREEVYVFTDKGSPEVIFGVSPVQHYPLLGLIWMMASEKLPRYGRELVTLVPQQIEKFHDRFPLLGNHVDARNKVHIAWIKRSGFSLLRVIPEYGLGKTPFIEFAKLRKPDECALAP